MQPAAGLLDYYGGQQDGYYQRPTRRTAPRHNLVIRDKMGAVIESCEKRLPANMRVGVFIQTMVRSSYERDVREVRETR